MRDAVRVLVAAPDLAPGMNFVPAGELVMAGSGYHWTGYKSFKGTTACRVALMDRAEWLQQLKDAKLRQFGNSLVWAEKGVASEVKGLRELLAGFDRDGFLKEGDALVIRGTRVFLTRV